MRSKVGSRILVLGLLMVILLAPAVNPVVNEEFLIVKGLDVTKIIIQVLNGSTLWNHSPLGSGQIFPLDAEFDVRLPKTPGLDCIGTDATGIIQAGICTGASVNTTFLINITQFDNDTINRSLLKLSQFEDDIGAGGGSFSNFQLSNVTQALGVSNATIVRAENMTDVNRSLFSLSQFEDDIGAGGGSFSNFQYGNITEFFGVSNASMIKVGNTSWITSTVGAEADFYKQENFTQDFNEVEGALFKNTNETDQVWLAQDINYVNFTTLDNATIIRLGNTYSQENFTIDFLEVEAALYHQANFTEDFNEVEGALFTVTNATEAGFLTNATYANFTGLELTGQLNMTNNNITDIQSLLAPDGSAIRFGADLPFAFLDQAIVLQSNQILGDGVIAFAVIDKQSTKILQALQVGKPESGSFHRNSQIDSEDFGITNASILTSCTIMMNKSGQANLIGCNSTTNGAGRYIQGGLQVGQIVYIGRGNKTNDIGINSRGIGFFDMFGNIFEVFNGSFHPHTPAIFEVGFTQGELGELLTADFAATLSPFQNNQTDLGNWEPVSSLLFCDSGQCAQADGSGIGDVFMTATYSSENFNKTNVSFVYSLIGITGGDTFNVFINNGSGDSLIFSDTGSDIQASQTILLDNGTWNRTSIDLKFECDGSNINKECYVDSVSVVGSAMETTNMNVSGQHTTILVGDGSQRIFWNDTTKVLELPGNTTAIGIQIQEINRSNFWDDLDSPLDITQFNDWKLVNFTASFNDVEGALFKTENESDPIWTAERGNYVNLTVLDNATINRSISLNNYLQTENLNNTDVKFRFLNVTENLTVIGNITANAIFANNLSGKLHCSDVFGGSDADHCTDGGGAGSDSGENNVFYGNTDDSWISVNQTVTGAVNLNLTGNISAALLQLGNITATKVFSIFQTASGTRIVLNTSKELFINATNVGIVGLESATCISTDANGILGVGSCAGADASAWNFANNDSLVLDNNTIIRTANTSWITSTVGAEADFYKQANFTEDFNEVEGALFKNTNETDQVWAAERINYVNFTTLDNATINRSLFTLSQFEDDIGAGGTFSNFQYANITEFLGVSNATIVRAENMTTVNRSLFTLSQFENDLSFQDSASAYKQENFTEDFNEVEGALFKNTNETDPVWLAQDINYVNFTTLDNTTIIRLGNTYSQENFTIDFLEVEGALFKNSNETDPIWIGERNNYINFTTLDNATINRSLFTLSQFEDDIGAGGTFSNFQYANITEFLGVSNATIVRAENMTNVNKSISLDNYTQFNQNVRYNNITVVNTNSTFGSAFIRQFNSSCVYFGKNASAGGFLSC